MRRAAHIQASIELLDEINITGKPADRCIATYFTQRRYIGSTDKRVISETIYTILRNKLSLTYVIEQAGGNTNSRLLCAALLTQQGQQTTDVFSGEQYAPAALRNDELTVIQALDFTLLTTAPLHVKFNIPEWLAEKFMLALGKNFEHEMRAFNQRAATDIRVNTLKTDIHKVRNFLKQSGSKPIKTALSPWCLRFNERVSLLHTKLYQHGHFDIQDEGSQLLALTTGAKSGHMVIDYCAGAGGKTLAMAAMMKNTGSIIACDIYAKRLQELQRRCKRAGVNNIQVHDLSEPGTTWHKKRNETADIVLVDAPCSGTGTWRRNPDSRWNLQPAYLEELRITQQNILKNAAKLVKRGGQLIYATCSILKEENEMQIDHFLRRHIDFEPGKFANLKQMQQHQDKFQLSSSQLRTYPAKSNTDAFFACVLKRKQ